MPRFLYTIYLTTIVLLVIALLGGLTWANTLYARAHPGEKDFFVPWLAVRTFLTYGDNPYSSPVAQRAQVVYYGRLASGAEDPLRLNIPFPFALFYFPFALVMDYALARALWMTCLEAALIAMAYLCRKLVDWKMTRSLLIFYFLFAILWIYGFLPLISSRAVIFAALALPGLLIALRDGRDELAGAILLVTFISLEITGVLIVFLFWWVLDNRRYRILAGFGMTLAILLAVSFFILPDWFIPYLGGMISHIKHNPGFTTGGILAAWWPIVGNRLSLAMMCLLLVVLVYEWREVRKKESRHFYWTLSLTLAITPLLGMKILPHDYVVLFFPLNVLLSIVAERWLKPGRWGLTGLILLGIFLGFWILTAGMLYLSELKGLINILVITFPMILVAGLYWIRWWVMHPSPTWSDSLS